MARTGISFDDVKTAATALLSRGEAPTIQLIREFLGTGSNTTISAHLKRWQNERSADTQVNRLPPAIPQNLLPALEVFWQSALEQAENTFAHYREELQQAHEQVVQERDAALAQCHELEQKLDRKAHTLQTLNTRLQISDKELQQVRDTAQSLQIHCAELEQQRQALQHTLKTCEQTLAQTHNEHNARLAACREEAREQLQQERARQQASAQHWRQHLEELRTEHRQREQHWSGLLQVAEQRRQEQQQTQQDQQQQWQAQLTQLQTALLEAQTKNATLSEQTRATQARLADTEQRLQDQQSAKENLIRANAVLQQQLEQCAQERQQLQQALAQLQTQIQAQLQAELTARQHAAAAQGEAPDSTG